MIRAAKANDSDFRGNPARHEPIVFRKNFELSCRPTPLDMVKAVPLGFDRDEEKSQHRTD